MTCIARHVKDCVELPYEAEQMTNRIKGLIPAYFGCDFELPKSDDCEPEPECSPMEAAMECFTEPEEFTDVCRYEINFNLLSSLEHNVLNGSF